MVKGMGGVMDFVLSVRIKVVVIMEYFVKVTCVVVGNI